MRSSIPSGMYIFSQLLLFFLSCVEFLMSSRYVRVGSENTLNTDVMISKVPSITTRARNNCFDRYKVEHQDKIL